MRKNNAADFKKAWDLIGQADKIFLTTHEGTDGDDLGSLLAVRQVLLSLGKSVKAAVKGPVPRTLKFLPGTSEVGGEFPREKFDLIVTFGCSKIERAGFAALKSAGIPVINFDHHPDNTFFAQVNVVDEKTAAVAELVYYFLQSKNIKLNFEIATCILTGIFTDTGGFKHANTSAEVMQVAADLLKKGARIDRIASYTFGQKRPQALKAWSRALENTRFDKNKEMVFSVLTEQDIIEVGAADDDLQGFVELLNHIPQAKFAMMLRQDGEVVRGSLRSELYKNVDVSRIARSFGGGGHKLAAGFKLNGKLTRVGNKWEIK
jgi:phosphoesterase RecJ-like protein